MDCSSSGEYWIEARGLGVETQIILEVVGLLFVNLVQQAMNSHCGRTGRGNKLRE